MSQRHEITVGERDVDPAAPSHIAGVREGNWPGRSRRALRRRGLDPVVTGGAVRSTGINPEDEDPIDPESPKLSPP
jgi:hypothetical protein